jgi:hypothetical protein
MDVVQLVKPNQLDLSLWFDMDGRFFLKKWFLRFNNIIFNGDFINLKICQSNLVFQ